MSAERAASRVERTRIDRRSWLRRAVAAGCCVRLWRRALGAGNRGRRPRAIAGGAGQARARACPGPRQGDHAPAATASRVGAISGGRRCGRSRSCKMTLTDCESLTRDFLAYYQEHGFDVKRPPRRLTLVIFLDERPYLEFARRFARGVSVYTWGFYSKLENWLVLFDFRNVPLVEKGAGHKNITTLAHEGTHQLTFNTGLLNRQGDAPRAVVEGIALYGETASTQWADRSRADQQDAARRPGAHSAS